MMMVVKKTGVEVMMENDRRDQIVVMMTVSGGE